MAAPRDITGALRRKNEVETPDAQSIAPGETALQDAEDTAGETELKAELEKTADPAADPKVETCGFKAALPLSVARSTARLVTPWATAEGGRRLDGERLASLRCAAAAARAIACVLQQ
ncbi:MULTISPECIES: hypothetical protein [unclassified Paraburkholderia]|uniref:hypothetical protein n=1 Tax=unclassified Paraburkholderia TaxID=2615204 RepID=UPI002AAFBEED|nr:MULTISPECIES: hypothetical protein [unclassified Paraburkholderia]